MLDLGQQTVRSYRKTMMKKLGVNNVAGLTQLALSAGLTRFPFMAANEQAGRWTRPGARCRRGRARSFLLASFLSPRWPSRSRPPSLKLASLLRLATSAGRARELARLGSSNSTSTASRAALIASVPGDEGFGDRGRPRFPERFFGYAMVNPIAPCGGPNCPRARDGPHQRPVLLSRHARLLDSGRLRRGAVGAHRPRPHGAIASSTAAS